MTVGWQEFYRGYSIQAFNTRRGWKYVIREGETIAWSSKPAKHLTDVEQVIAIAKKDIDERQPPVLGVQTDENINAEDRFGA